MPTSLVAILNAANNYTQRVKLSSPIEEDYVRFLANREDLITASFLANSYVYDSTLKTFNPSIGTALTGSKLAYKIKEKTWFNAQIELINKLNTPEEIQLVCYFFT